ncbi:hypothetical protein HPB47_006586 [Ixodes persulcatus]|uniref:Uncharacterized protein n=1 Tax=Ixodes persulcatus TaxID=34615 RepID=A0AC60P9X1_IXOPE|nr:hypothetical protein HPB47_006586 [Ixodes persulcatus]
MLIAGFRTPEGRVLVEHIEEAWKCDNKSLTPLRAMPRVTKPVLHSNGFEKMSVSYAIRLYSDEVVRGLYLYKQEVERRFGTTTATECFVKKMRDLISVMTSRRSKGALRPGSRKEAELQEFLDYLNTWEASAGMQGQGFLSRSTAEGLRVTLSSTLSLLHYVTGELGYRYLLTSRLGQDPIENLFGILRQMSGCNDHPTPSQLLVSVNCLTFANLAKSPTGGNVTGSTLRSLLNPSNAQEAQRRVDDLLDLFNLQEAKATLDACGIVTDQLSLTRERSDSRLVFYIAGKAKEVRLRMDLGDSYVEARVSAAPETMGSVKECQPNTSSRSEAVGVGQPSQPNRKSLVNTRTQPLVVNVSGMRNVDRRWGRSSFMNLNCRATSTSSIDARLNVPCLAVNKRHLLVRRQSYKRTFF